MSYGQRKLLELASLLVADPAVLLLDEPAGGVNPTLIKHLAERIAELNGRHRGKAAPTDVLSFPIDGPGSPEPRELGDIVICPEHTEDLREAVIHGALHLTGMDHETDDGEMLALQAELLRWAR